MTSHGGWDPLKELSTVQKRMNQLFESALARTTDFETSEGFDGWTPVCDAWETPESLRLAFEVPGLEQDQIELRLDGDELVFEGDRHMDRDHSDERYHRVERSYGRFHRRIRLPSSVDREAVQAEYRNGMLYVVMPKRGSQGPDEVRVSID